MTLAAWLHDLSPFAIRFTQGFGLRWYGLSYALGFLLGWLILRWLSVRRIILIPPERVGDAILYAVVGVVVGGRLGYVLVYEPSLLVTFSGGFPWWGLLAINQGGMASHGGLAGVIIAAFFIARGWKDEHGVVRGRTGVLHILDALALITPTGLLLGRLANFINGELLGKIVAMPGQPAPAWAIKYPQEVLVGRWPGTPDRTIEQRRQLEDLVATYAPTAPDLRSGYEHVLDLLQRGNQTIASQLEPLISARVPSQLYQAAAEGLITGAVLWLIAMKPRRPGVIGATFMVTYGILRIITEQFWRLPDAQFKVGRPYGLSRGQWLSVAMIAVGVFFLFWIARRAAPKLGGWAVRHAPDGTPLSPDAPPPPATPAH